MPRYALKIEYDGAPFVGWQRQRTHLGVQQVIEDALQRLESEVEGIVGAGRTDAGVHALGQVAHVDLAQDWTSFRLSEALNYHLRGQPISIVATALVADDFHARFSAKKRHYLFRILSRRALPVFDKGHVWHIKYPLALEPMQEAANMLLGKHDFTTFRSTICQAQSPIKTLDQLDVSEHPAAGGGMEYHFTVSARSFLHNQVRSFVGTLERIGARKWEPERVKFALEARERDACGPVCPPQGLYLRDVDYEKPIFEAYSTTRNT